MDANGNRPPLRTPKGFHAASLPRQRSESSRPAQLVHWRRLIICQRGRSRVTERSGQPPRRQNNQLSGNCDSDEAPRRGYCVEAVLLAGSAGDFDDDQYNDDWDLNDGARHDGCEEDREDRPHPQQARSCRLGRRFRRQQRRGVIVRFVAAESH